MSENDQHQFKDRYMLRLPDGMRNRIRHLADLNHRSMNSEIVRALTHWIEQFDYHQHDLEVAERTTPPDIPNVGDTMSDGRVFDGKHFVEPEGVAPRMPKGSDDIDAQVARILKPAAEALRRELIGLPKK